MRGVYEGGARPVPLRQAELRGPGVVPGGDTPADRLGWIAEVPRDLLDRVEEDAAAPGGLVVCAALRLEARAVRRGLARAPVVVVGYRARRPPRASGGVLAVVGFGGALDERLRPGDVLVADEIRGGGPALPCHRPEALAGELARELAGKAAGELARENVRARPAGGPGVVVGPLLTSPNVVAGAERARLAAQGARAVDMETAVLAAVAPGRRFAAVRVIVDGPRHPLWRPGTLVRGVTALRTLARVGPALERWASSAPDDP
ncbi:hypothetical protein ACFHW2_26900 [Actinomadura sp. LOL_016]|uniref:phosphorylase family protein n=1 Tax=unclassified Actinomadura TaxID=2626254 RepID=UPI003A802713